MNWSLLLQASAPGATEEIARAAYKELLAAPLPTTPADFRRAIMQGVLIGRTLESSQPGNGWQKGPPTAPGVWEMRCAETNHEPSTVRVVEQAGALWVDDPAIGTNTLAHYHGGLIDIHWRLVVQA